VIVPLCLGGEKQKMVREDTSHGDRRAIGLVSKKVDLFSYNCFNVE
jgi:hypothetical protein